MVAPAAKNVEHAPGEPCLVNWHRLLGRPVSEYGRLCHGDGGHGRGVRRRRVLVLPTLSRQGNAGSGVGSATHAFRVPVMALVVRWKRFRDWLDER